MKELEWNASTLATDLMAMNPSWLETIQIIRHFDVHSVAYSFTSTTKLYFWTYAQTKKVISIGH